VEIHADPAAALGAAVVALPAGFLPPVRIPSGYFPDLALDPALPGELRTGEALEVVGRVTKAGAGQLALDFTPRGEGERISFFIDVEAGRVDRAVVFDHTEAGEYDLAVFAGASGEELEYLGSFSPVRVGRGTGMVQLPATYFNGLRLDGPLPGTVLLGASVPVAGQVRDPTATTVLFQLSDASGEAAASAYLDVAAGRFSGSLPTADLPAGTYRLAVYAGADELAYAGAYPHLHIAAELPTAVAVGAATPGRLALEQNYPNPFNQGTTIRFRLPGPGRDTVHLAVYNVLGQRLATLVDGPLGPGEHVAHWDGRLDGARAAATGVYLYRLIAGQQVLTRRLALTR